MHNYPQANSVFPLGSFKKNELITPCGTTHEQSFLVGLAPYYEQAQVFNSYNSSLHVYDYGADHEPRSCRATSLRDPWPQAHGDPFCCLLTALNALGHANAVIGVAGKRQTGMPGNR